MRANPHSVLVFVMFLWTSGLVVSKSAASFMTPFELSFSRWVICSLILKSKFIKSDLTKIKFLFFSPHKYKYFFIKFTSASDFNFASSTKGNEILLIPIFFYKSLKKNKGFLNPFFKDTFVTKNRQNLKKIYSPNGAIYIFYSKDFMQKERLSFIKSGYYIMNKIDSIDIDSKEDYVLAKYLSKKYLKIKK